MRLFRTSRLVWSGAVGVMLGNPPAMAWAHEVVAGSPTFLTEREIMLLSMAAALVVVLMAVIAFQILALVKLRERPMPVGGPRMSVEELDAAAAHVAELTSAVNDGIAIFDSEARLVHANRQFHRMYPDLADLLTPGSRFSDIQRAWIEKGIYEIERGQWNGFLESRVKAFDRPSKPKEYRLSNGKWVLVSERSTADGGLISVHRDITDLKDREVARRESEELFSVVFHASPAISSISDSETGVIVDVNQSWENTLGYRREEVIGRSVIDLGIVVNPDIRASIVAKLNRGRTVTNVEMQLQTKSGELRDFLMSADLLEMSGRSNLLLVFQDITDLKVAQDRLVDAIESVNEAFALYDADERLVLCNSRYREMLSIIAEDVKPGAAFKDLLSKAVSLGLHPEARGREREFIQDRLASFRRCEGSEELRVAPDRWMLNSERRTKHDEIVGIRTDITELKRREQALRDSEARYRSLVETLPDAILVHRDRRILYANGAAATLLGVDNSEDLIGRRVLDFIEDDDQPRFRKRERDLIQYGGSNPPTEMTFVRDDGSPVVVEITVSRLISEATPSIELILRDLTQRKQAERELIQTSKMATLGEMAASMAHELSQPLNIIRFAAEGTLMKIARGTADDEYQQNQLKIIEAQSQRMSEIMDHMRVFSRSDTTDIEPFDPVETVNSAVDLIRNQFRPDGITITTRFPNRSGIVRGRPVQLEQVILNLLSNARDAILARRKENPSEADSIGRINITVSGDRRLHMIRIVVADNGTGIPNEKISRIFEPFYTSKEIGSGTGLGLSVSYSIVTSMAGTIMARNTKNGAEFEIMLPVFLEEVSTATDVDDDPSAEAEVPAVGPYTRHILVVDDEDRAVRAMAEYLIDEGYRVSIANDGMEAINRFKSDRADIVVTDIRMPRCDGRELIKNLRAVAPDLPIIVHTGHISLKEAAEENFESEITTVLRKPTSLLELGEAIQRFVRRR